MLKNFPIDGSENGFKHESGPDCPCGPEIEYSGDKGDVYIHFSLDGREYTWEEK